MNDEKETAEQELPEIEPRKPSDMLGHKYTGRPGNLPGQDACELFGRGYDDVLGERPPRRRKKT